MKLSTILIGSCLSYTGSALATGVAPRDNKVQPFLETLEAVTTATDNLRQAILDWDGLPLTAFPIIGNASVVTKQLQAGIERIKGARRLHAKSELKLKKPAKKAAASQFNTLQIIADNYRRFSEAATKPTVRSTIRKHKELAAALNEVMCTKFGAIARSKTREGGMKAAMWFDEVAEIFAKKKDKNPEEDKKRRAKYPKWEHIKPPIDT